MKKSTFKSTFAPAFHKWAQAKNLQVVLPRELSRAGQCAAHHHSNGLITVEVWDHGHPASEEVTLPGERVLELIELPSNPECGVCGKCLAGEHCELVCRS